MSGRSLIADSARQPLASTAMLSERKSLLRASEVIAALAAAATLAQAARTFAAPPTGYPAFVAATLCMLGLLLTFLPVCLLGAEYIRTVRKPRLQGEEQEGISGAELSFLTRWAPRSHKAAAWLAMAILIGTLFTFGDVTVTTSSDLEPGKVPGLFLYFSGFYLICLPILGSASRMSGTYAMCCSTAEPDEP